MRIIAGKYRSRKLVTLEGLHTRPTLDSTKEAIFSSMGNYLPSAVVLDVFGGSGALSLESLSRGASKAYIIDNSNEAINIIKTNAKNLNVTSDELIIFQGSYQTILPKLAKQKFDIVFIDPPFRMKVIDEIISFLVEHQMVNPGGFIMAEYPRVDIVNKQYPNYQIRMCRTYASSEILILEREN